MSEYAEYEALGICPGCGSGIESWAISRFDDLTKICDACRGFESVTLANGGTLESPGFEFTGTRGQPVIEITDVFPEAEEAAAS